MPHFPKPFFRKSRGLWYVQVNGQQYNLGPDRTRAFEQYHDLMRQPQPKRVASDSVVAIIDAFLDWCQKHRAPDTYLWYQSRLQLFVKAIPAGLAVSRLKPFHLQQWIDSYDHLSSGAKRNYCRAVVRTMNWAEEQGLIDRTPLAHFKKPRAGRRETVISPDEYEQILACVCDENFRDLLVFAWETGARATECMAIEKRHVDLANARIIFPPAEEKMGRAPRIIYLSDRASEIIRRLMLRTHNNLFVNTDGTPWTARSLNCAFIRIQIRMGRNATKAKGVTISPDDVEEFIPKLRPVQIVKGREISKTPAELREEARRKLRNRLAARHAKKYCLTAFRHSWCHHALCRGIDALTVSVLMGHADPTMVAKVYSHLGHAPQFLSDQAKKAVS
jgi:integrase